MQLQSVLAEPSIKTDHILLCQIISTLGQISNASEPWFREEGSYHLLHSISKMSIYIPFSVILPQLLSLSSYAAQITNQTRRKDITYKLLETFSTIIYCPMSKQTISTCLLPALRNLEHIDLPSNVHQEQIVMMIKDVESRLDIVTSPSPSILALSNSSTSSLTHNVEEMRLKMSKILSPNIKNVPNNLQGIFKKK